MLQNLNTVSEMPSRLYRSSEEIKRDMSKIREGMTRIDSMLAVHNLRISLYGECSAEELRERITELQSAVKDADKALRLLARFSSAVTELGRELDEMRCTFDG